MKLEPASSADTQFLEALTAAGLPTDDLAESGNRFFALHEDGQVVGYGGYQMCEQSALLRSVVVLPGHRGKGYGNAGTELILAEASGAGAKRAYLLTTDAADYFQRAGFLLVDRAEVPTAVLATRQASALCPSTATILSRQI